jgi:hypothetical protein
MNVEVSDPNYGNMEGDVGIGGNIFVDYLLPISIPLSLGVEVGVDTSKITQGGLEDTVLAIPILARVAYHFDIMPKLDLYVVGKIGYVAGIWTGDNKDYFENYNLSIKEPGGFGFGFDVGAAFYFTPTVGIFGEGGFDNYMLEAKVETVKVKMPFYRFLTVGLSLKF